MQAWATARDRENFQIKYLYIVSYLLFTDDKSSFAIYFPNTGRFMLPNLMFKLFIFLWIIKVYLLCVKSGFRGRILAIPKYYIGHSNVIMKATCSQPKILLAKTICTIRLLM